MHGSRARIILTTPEGIHLKYTFRLGFKTSNKEAEYEARLVGLQLATAMGAQLVQVYSDSQLIVNQVLQQYEAREDSMVAYLTLV